MARKRLQTSLAGAARLFVHLLFYKLNVSIRPQPRSAEVSYSIYTLNLKLKLDIRKLF